jgi:hypothetical protein
MPDIATELRDALHAYAETVQPADESWVAVAARRPGRALAVTRRVRPLAVAAAGLAVVVLIAVVALRPGHTRVQVGPAGKTSPSGPPFPDLTAPASTPMATGLPPQVYVVLRAEQFRLVAWPDGDHACFFADAGLGTGGTSCAGNGPAAATALSQINEPGGVGLVTFGVAAESAVEVAVVGKGALTELRVTAYNAYGSVLTSP